MNNYAPRISASFADISGVISQWYNLCEKVAIFEHPADRTVKRTHCHLLLMGCTVKAEALKRRFTKEYPNEGGNKFWKWESKREPSVPIIRYFSKGRFHSKYLQGITQEEEEHYRSLWVGDKPAILDDVISQLGDTNEIVVKPQQTLITESFNYKAKKANQWDEMLRAFINKWTATDHVPLDVIRKWAFHWFFTNTGQIPPVSLYKQRVASLYYFHKYEKDEQDEAYEDLKNLWY